MDTQLKGWLQSSQDPSEVANKVKGAILLCSSLIILLATQLIHIQLNANDVITLATEGGTCAGAIWAIYGSVLHLITWWGTVQKIAPMQQAPAPIDPGAASFNR